MDGIDHTIGEFIYRPSPIFLDGIFVVAGAKDHPWLFGGGHRLSACKACAACSINGSKLPQTAFYAAFDLF